jgi:hypothetical protein
VNIEVNKKRIDKFNLRTIIKRDGQRGSETRRKTTKEVLERSNRSYRIEERNSHKKVEKAES